MAARCRTPPAQKVPGDRTRPKGHRCFPAGTGALNRVAAAAPDDRAAGAGRDRLIAPNRVNEGITGAAGDRVAGDAADRHIAGGAQDRVTAATPDRPVTGAAADD